MELILKYFPNLTEIQKSQFEALYALYLNWNEKINVISRKDIENLYEHHVLHSLTIAEILRFQPGTTILDVGTGGGFPGIPLAILFPEVNFVLIDSIGKKIKVGTEVAAAIGLKNITLKHLRVQEEKGKFDFVVSRAVMPLGDLVKLVLKNIAKKQLNALPNGLICLKGGELQQEILPFKKVAELYDVSEFFQEEYFVTKKAVYIPL
jgi:16S rRNA (guanine527-N7)-methyltransferase